MAVPEGVFDEPPPEAPAGPVPEAVDWATELTPELVERLCSAARIGGFRRETALACGVLPDDLDFWLDEGQRKDAPELMRRLSARFQSIQSNTTLGYVDIVRTAARGGDWEAAVTILRMREPLWKGTADERKPEAPENSLAERYSELVKQLKDPRGDLAKALREAGYPVPEQETEVSHELRALLAKGRDENPGDE